MTLERENRRKRIWNDRHLYLLLLPAFLATLIFNYLPMGGLVIAFEDFSIYDGILGSEWVGFENFKKILTQKDFLMAIWNTLAISLLSLIINFPAPIILALLINELERPLFKRVTQTVSYLPHFLSWMSVVGIIHILFGRDGLVNDVLVRLGAADRVTFLANQNNFIKFVIGTTLWKEVGWATIIHLANLASINQELYEAASIDGANRLQQLRHITLPHMLPTVSILFIFQMGSLFASNFQLVYGLQNPYVDFEVISTIIYRSGIQNGNYSLSTALGFMQGIVALILVVVTNKLSKKVTGNGVW